MEKDYDADTMPFGGYGTYEEFAEMHGENNQWNWDFSLIYKEKEYWFLHNWLGKKKHHVLTVYYVDEGADDDTHNRQADETAQNFDPPDIRNVMDHYIMHDGRPFLDVLKEVKSFVWN